MYEKIRKALRKDTNQFYEHVEEDVIYLASGHRAVRLKNEGVTKRDSIAVKKLFDAPVLCTVKVPRKEILHIFDIAKKECDTLFVLIKDRQFTVLPRNPQSDLVTASYEIDTDVVTDFCVNPKYVAQILKWSKEENIIISTGAPKKPTRIECEFTALVAQKSR